MEQRSDTSLNPEVPAATRHGAQIARVFQGRYDVVRTLCAAPGSETLLARVTNSGESVVIKAIALPTLSAGARLRLEHEQGVLQGSGSDYLAPIREIGRTAGWWYCVRCHVPGVTLAEALAVGELGLAESLTLARCLFSAVQVLHAHGVLHRNIKPTNLLLNSDALAGEVVLVDGGLWKGGQLEAGDVGPDLASAAYLSPEQAGLIDCGLGEPSDLYAVGLILFECVAGHSPFKAESVGAILLEHMTAEIPRLRSTQPQVPRALDDLIQRLLRKDPRDRYQSAAAALFDLEQIGAAWESGDRDPELVLGRADRRRTLTPPAFVSRRRELDELCAHVGRAQAGRGGLVLVEGESGRGKSRLLTELSQRGSEAGFWTLRGQGQSAVGQKPLQMLGGMIQSLLAVHRSEPGLVDSLRDRLGHHCEAVAAALPELASLLRPTDTPLSVPEAFGEARTVEALASFLDALGTESRPALVILDDCQWADDLLIRLLARWQGRRQADPDAACHVLVVVSFRSDEVGADHRLHNLPVAAHLRLSPFDANEIRQLAESMAGPLPAEALELILRHSDGSPFMASAVLYGLVESGALVPEADGWRVEPLRHADLQSSHSATAFLLRRVELLQPDTIETLSIGAVLGKEFELGIAVALTGQTPTRFMAALEEARKRNLVWLNTTSSHGIFVHDRLREALLERLAPPYRRQLHARAAAHLQHVAPDRVFDLAYHFDAAGDQERALPYALAAAEQARTQHSLQVAEQQYRIAERGALGADDEIRYRIAAGLGEVQMLRGEYDEAAELFMSAARFAGDQLARARITLKLGEVAFKRGEMETATQAFEQSMRDLGHYVPRRYAMVLVLLVWEALVQGLHTVFPGLFVARRHHNPTESELLRFRIFSRLAHGYWFIRGKVHVLWAHLRGMNLAECYLPTLELAQSYSEHAPAMSLVPWYGRGIAYARKSFIIRKSLGDLWGQGQSLHYHGIVLFVASRFHECVEKCREAVRLLERTGDFWEVHIARYQIAAALYRLGDLSGAVVEARRIHHSGRELGDYQASGISLDVWARATDGAVPPEILEVELERHRHDAQGTAQVLLAQGVCRMGANEPAQAAAAFERALEVARQAGVMNAYVSPNWAWLATALRQQAQADTSSIPRQRRRLLRAAAVAACQAVWLALRFRNDLPHALREAALILSLWGRVRSARLLLRASLAVARRQGARYELARTAAARARIHIELDCPGAEDEMRQAEILLRDLALRAEKDGRADSDPEFATFSLVDRFDVVLDAGRRIASALTAETVFAEAREAARRLLRGEKSEIIAIGPNGDCSPEDAAYRALLAQALSAGGVVTEDDDGSEPGHSGGTAGPRSALCAPIFVRGAAVAGMCITHQQVRGLFGPNEERLADFITTITGAALENADGFRQLQGLNSTLEERVAERTAAAEKRARELAVSNHELERTAAELRSTEEQLRIAKDAAEAASHAKSRFLATMSHEIRTPMNGVIGMTELALKTRLTTQQQSYLHVVKQSADALLRLLNDILDFSKIEAGKLELEEMPFDLRELVGDSVRILSVRAAQTNLELMYRVAPEVPLLVAGDAGRLRQVLVNLVGNAVKFTPQGEVRIDVGVVERNSSEVVLRFAVTDTGIGIPLEKQQRIFESFSQADSSITRRFGGTGLGLAISAQLVELMQGRLIVESQPGSGSTFHFTSRFAVPAAAAAVTAISSTLPHLPVLVVDDHPASRRIHSELLTQIGLETHSAENARTALELLDAAAAAGHPFRLAVIDTAMPGHDGWVLAEQIRATQQLADCPIIFLTPAGQVDVDSLTAGFSNAWHLSKPAKGSELIDAVRQALGPMAQVTTEDSAERGPGRRGRILLVDDAPVNQEVAQGLLEMQGYEVSLADNGRHALAALDREAFDVILMDLEMPEMDGMSATAEIRRRELATSVRTPIIAMTAHGLSALRAECLELGMDGYLTKPIQPQELFDALDLVQRQCAEARGLV